MYLRLNLALQDGLLEHNALAAAVRALQPSSSAAPAPAPVVAATAAAAATAAVGGDGAVELGQQHSWSRLATAEEGEALRCCRVLLSRAAPERAVPDLALWRSWLVLVRREG